MRYLLMFKVIIWIFLLSSTSLAQTCAYQWCDAPWPPATGSDRTVGKTNCGETCIKIVGPAAITDGIRLFYWKNDNAYHEDFAIDDISVSSSTWIILKVGGVEVGRINKNYVIGWIKIRSVQ